MKESGKREVECRINASSISGKGEIMTWLGSAALICNAKKEWVGFPPPQNK